MLTKPPISPVDHPITKKSFYRPPHCTSTHTKAVKDALHTAPPRVESVALMPSESLIDSAGKVFHDINKYMKVGANTTSEQVEFGHHVDRVTQFLQQANNVLTVDKFEMNMAVKLFHYPHLFTEKAKDDTSPALYFTTFLAENKLIDDKGLFVIPSWLDFSDVTESEIDAKEKQAELIIENILKRLELYLEKNGVSQENRVDLCGVLGATFSNDADSYYLANAIEHLGFANTETCTNKYLKLSEDKQARIKELLGDRALELEGALAKQEPFDFFKRPFILIEHPVLSQRGLEGARDAALVLELGGIPFIPKARNEGQADLIHIEVDIEGTPTDFAIGSKSVRSSVESYREILDFCKASGIKAPTPENLKIVTPKDPDALYHEDLGVLVVKDKSGKDVILVAENGYIEDENYAFFKDKGLLIEIPEAEWTLFALNSIIQHPPYDSLRQAVVPEKALVTINVLEEMGYKVITTADHERGGGSYRCKYANSTILIDNKTSVDEAQNAQEIAALLGLGLKAMDPVQTQLLRTGIEENSDWVHFKEQKPPVPAAKL